MFEILLIAAALIALGGAVIAYDGSRDVFHPLMFIGPMMAFLYAWMPFQLLRHNGLAQFFDNDQLVRVQWLNVLGVAAFVLGCLGAGVRIRRTRYAARKLTPLGARRLLLASGLCGTVGLICWMTTIHNVGGFRQAFSTSYGGGYDPNGYVRDGTELLLVGAMMSITAMVSGGSRLRGIVLLLMCSLPWAISAVMLGRRGPTFGLVVILLMSWYFNKGKRPPVLTFGLGGLALGWLVLFLVTNRQNLYFGSDFNMKTDVSTMVDKPDTGNEFIYGSGTVLATEQRDHYFWMRRYLAQILVRPIPSSIWPTKYEDFGVPELLYNGGTDAGIADALGWRGAPGSAPGIVGDLFVEVSWFAIVLMAVLGWIYGRVWRKAVSRGGVWTLQYIVLSALSIYLVMQTMEAVIFRSLELSLPCWLAFRYVEKRLRSRSRRRLFMPRAEVYARRLQARKPRLIEALQEAPHA